MAKFAATSIGHVSLNLIDLDAIGIRVTRDGEPFQVFAVTVHKPDRIRMRRDGEHVNVTRQWLWRGALAAGAEMLPSIVQAGLADGSLPASEPRVARQISVSAHRMHEVCEHARTLPLLDHAHLVDFEIGEASSDSGANLRVDPGTGPVSGPPDDHEVDHGPELPD